MSEVAPRDEDRPPRSVSNTVDRQHVCPLAKLAAAKAANEERPTWNRNEIRQLVESSGGLVKIQHAADGIDKNKVNRQLGLTMTYDHENGWCG
ncbi:hypothetical protein DFR70_12263 [Nocardia tenerifensis]|uniref:Uncharacterized protein n=1 Tax=Nocardia tenerifensis TaxID=228006 RepID=A0A318JQ31_9NOCA|nr:hypothetical protein [Nocardia tenerifensis]PXX54922.1 hypothetical protein DFR70_12263 [Nocardia tenerifensis]